MEIIINISSNNKAKYRQRQELDMRIKAGKKYRQRHQQGTKQ